MSYGLCAAAATSGGRILLKAVDVLESSPVAVPHPMRQLAASAARLAIDLGHPAYDCFTLALAVQGQYPRHHRRPAFL